MKPYREVLTIGFCSAEMAPDLSIRERLNKALCFYIQNEQDHDGSQ